MTPRPASSSSSATTPTATARSIRGATWTAPARVRIDIDTDEDGKIDRWEYYGPISRSRRSASPAPKTARKTRGRFSGPNGAVERVEVSTRRDGKVTRIEHFKGDKVVTAEEDSDEDGKIDKWETYDGDRLASVAFDTQHRGTADRRLVYGADGTVRLELDQAGAGHFTPAPRAGRRAADDDLHHLSRLSAGRARRCASACCGTPMSRSSGRTTSPTRSTNWGGATCPCSWTSRAARGPPARAGNPRPPRLDAHVRGG